MKNLYRWCSRCITIGCVGVVLLCVFAPLTQTTIGNPPMIADQQRVRLEHNLVRITQTIPLPGATPHKLAIRIFVQQVKSYQPFLTIRASAEGQTFGPVAVELPPVDGTFHMIELPWWSVKPRTKTVDVSVTGHGVLIATAQAVEHQRNTLRLNRKQQRSTILATQLLTRTGGIEAYVPVLRIAQDKPGPLGNPRFLLLLSAVAVLLVTMMLKRLFFFNQLFDQVEVANRQAFRSGT